MAGNVAREIEVRRTLVSVDAGTDSATIQCITNQGPMQLYLAADVLLYLQEQIAKELAEARHNGLRILPIATGCHGLEVGPSQSLLQIRLVLEGGSEARLPIQEFALARLNRILMEWFAEDRD
jgi:hypothetical protein